MPSVSLDPDRPLSLTRAHDIVEGRADIELSESAVAALERSRGVVDELVDQRRRVYGVTTGYGPLATEYVGPERSEELQRNLVYHLATGVGDPLSPRATRAMMVARASSLSRGHSALRPDSLGRLLALLNRQVVPVVPSLGTVGASGDLTPLAHMTLALLGEGEVHGPEGPRPAADALEEADIDPIDLTHKEGLAFVNGTSAMTGLAVLNAIDAVRACEVALRASLLNAEVFRGRSEAWSELVGRVRPHPGQQSVIRQLAAWTEDSDRLRRGRAAGGRLPDGDGADDDQVYHRQELPQDPYSIRCLPQLFGAILDGVRWHNRTAETELNSVTDNPIFDPEAPEGERVVHAGNFFGQHLALASDTLSNALISVGVHAERVVARLCDPARNGDLPAFLTGREHGLHSGFMGAQVTATSLVAEMRTKSQPASTQSISTNANNQDVVTMGTIGALRARQQLDRLFELLAIESLVCAQAFDLSDGPDAYSTASRQFVDTIRQTAPGLEGDRPLSAEIAELADDLRHRPTQIDLT